MGKQTLVVAAALVVFATDMHSRSVRKQISRFTRNNRRNCFVSAAPASLSSVL